VRSLRAALAGTAASAALLLTACGQSGAVDAVPGAVPYDGPLHVEVTAAPDDPTDDHGGAAGQAVDCDATPVGGSRSEPYDGGPVSRSPEAALRRDSREAGPGGREGLREVRREADRVLYVDEVDGRTRQAAVVHRGRSVTGSTGWYVETWARCDWAELPPAWAQEQGTEVWSDAAGHRVPTSRVQSSAGPAHCGWQDMTFLGLDGGDLDGGQTYVEHPDPAYYPDYFTVAYRRDADLPADAVDTGYERGGRHLWLAPDASRAFVGTRSSVAVWPRTVQPLGCA